MPAKKIISFPSRTGADVDSSTFSKTFGVRSRVQAWGSAERTNRDNSVARYTRVAMLETVLNIRERNRRFARRMIVAGLLVMGVAVITSGILGWI